MEQVTEGVFALSTSAPRLRPSSMWNTPPSLVPPAAEARPGAQVDLVIDRRDDLVELCEMKYRLGEFEIDAAYADRLRNKVEAFRRERSPCRKAIHVVMASLNGVAHNAHFREVVTSEVRGEALFGRRQRARKTRGQDKGTIPCHGFTLPRRERCDR